MSCISPSQTAIRFQRTWIIRRTRLPLVAFHEVEDGLSLTQRLATEVTQQRDASEQASQALTISTMLYVAGLDN